MIKPYNYTTELYFNDERVWSGTSTRLFTEEEVKEIENTTTAILAADAYSPDPEVWNSLGDGWYSFKEGIGISLKIKKKYSIVSCGHGYGISFDSRKNPVVSIAVRRKAELAKKYSFKDVFEYKDISRAAEYLKQFNLPINFSIDKSTEMCYTIITKGKEKTKMKYSIYIGCKEIARVMGMDFAGEVYSKAMELAAMIDDIVYLVDAETGEVLGSSVDDDPASPLYRGEDPDESGYDPAVYYFTDDDFEECGFDPYEGCYTYDC